MKLVIQRVNSASVFIDNSCYSSINKGILVYVGFSKKDTSKCISWACKKILHLRIFEENQKGFQKTIQDINGEILLISQFTLYGDIQQSTKPKFNESMDYSNAEKLYEELKKELESHINIKTGKFGAMMNVESVNNGPVTLIAEKNLS